MTGVDFFKKVKDKGTYRKYILLADYHDSEVIKEADNDVIIHWYMDKPFDNEKLEHIIKKEIEDFKSHNLLRKSENSFRSAFHSMADVFTRSDNDGKCLMISPSVYNILGYKPEEILGKNFVDLYADPNHRIEIVNKLQKTKKVENFEVDVLTKDGKTITVSANAKIYFNSIGEPLGVESVFRDITEHKQAEIELERSKSLIQTVIDGIPDVIMLVNLDYSVALTNKNMNGTVDSTDLVSKGLKCYEISHHKTEPCCGEDHLCPLDKVKETLASVVVEHIHTDSNGQNIYIEITASPVFNENGELVRIIESIKDITDRKVAEKKKEESETKFRTLVTNTEEIIYIIAKDGTFLLSEGKGLSKIGLKPGEVVGESVFELYKDYPDMLDKVRQAINGETVVEDFKVGELYFKSWYTPHSNQKGEIIGLLGLSINISEQKKAEFEILEYQKRLKDLTHEIIITEEKVRKQIATDLHDQVGQLLSSMRMQLSRIPGLVENPEIEIRINNISQGLLKAIRATREAIFNLSPPQLNEIGLYAAVHDWIKVQIDTKYNINSSIIGEDVQFHLEENTKLLLFRSIRELVMNVLKHARAKRLNVNFARNKEILEVTVQDDGIGFNYNPDLQRLKSNAYGLFSIQERIMDLGGSMEVDAASDKGTKIKLLVPIIDKKYEN